MKSYENLYKIVVFARSALFCLGFLCFSIDFLLIFEGCLKRNQCFPRNIDFFFSYPNFSQPESGPAFPASPWPHKENMSFDKENLYISIRKTCISINNIYILIRKTYILIMKTSILIRKTYNLIRKTNILIRNLCFANIGFA